MKYFIYRQFCSNNIQTWKHYKCGNVLRESEDGYYWLFCPTINAHRKQADDRTDLGASVLLCVLNISCCSDAAPWS